MIYQYRCDQCQVELEIVKSVADYERVESCQKCKSILQKVFTTPTLSIKKTFFQHFNPGLGEIVKSKNHYNEIIKTKGLIELGNENIDKIDRKLTDEKEKKWAKDWDDLVDKVV